MCYSYHAKTVVTKNGKAIAGELSCKKWACKECGPKRRKKWESRFDIFSNIAGQFQNTYCTSRTAYKSLLRKINRKFGHHITIRIGDVYEVFHTPTSKNRELWMVPNKMLAKALAAKYRVRITAGKSVPYPLDWNGRPKMWTLLAVTPLSIEELNRRLDTNGYSRFIMIGEVFPISLVKAFIGEDFALSAKVSEDTKRLINAEETVPISFDVGSVGPPPEIGVDEPEYADIF